MKQTKPIETMDAWVDASEAHRWMGTISFTENKGRYTSEVVLDGVDFLVGDTNAFQLLAVSVVGSGNQLRALNAALRDSSYLRVEAPVRVMGEPLRIPRVSHHLRVSKEHRLVSDSNTVDLPGVNGKAGRNISHRSFWVRNINKDGYVLVLSKLPSEVIFTLSDFYKVPVAPRWAGTLYGDLVRKGKIQPAFSIGVDASIVTITEEEFLKLVETNMKADRCRPKECRTNPVDRWEDRPLAQRRYDFIQAMKTPRLLSTGTLTLSKTAERVIEEACQSPDSFLFRHESGQWETESAENCQALENPTNDAVVTSLYTTVLGDKIRLTTEKFNFSYGTNTKIEFVEENQEPKPQQPQDLLLVEAVEGTFAPALKREGSAFTSESTWEVEVLPSRG